jgi:hypothetical protein
MTEETNSYTVAEINCNDNTTTYRPMTDEEIAQLNAFRAEAEEKETQRVAEQTAKAALKASAEAKLAALGLTAEEIAAL